jgi:predicted nucleic acid-binding Zn ribbon protein
MHPLKESGKGSLKSVGSLLSSIFKDLGIEDKISLNSMQEEWHRLFNEPLSLHTYPVDIKEGELTINVDSPAWLGQLKFFKQDIIKKLQAYNISSVKFKHGRVYQKRVKSSELRVQSEKNSKTQNSKPLTLSELEWADQIVSSIEDPDLKEDIRKAIEKSLR